MSEKTNVIDQEVEQIVKPVVSNEAKIEKLILKFITNKEIARERISENEIIIDEIREVFENMGDEDFVLELPSGDYAHVTKKPRIREVLDKEALANELQLAVDDIKTPFDISKLTADGKLTPKMITSHTSTEVKVNVSVARKKNKPKKKKQ